MATTTTTRTRRSSEDWDALARELLPELQAGRKVSDLTDRIGSNDEAFRTALARIGYDPHGNPLKLKSISARTDATLAKRVAARRENGAPWWLVMAETRMSYAKLNRILREHGYAENGASAS